MKMKTYVKALRIIVMRPIFVMVMNAVMDERAMMGRAATIICD